MLEPRSSGARDQDSPPLAADPISMVTAGTDSYDSASLKHFLQELSSPKSQCSMLRKLMGSQVSLSAFTALRHFPALVGTEDPHFTAAIH